MQRVPGIGASLALTKTLALIFDIGVGRLRDAFPTLLQIVTTCDPSCAEFCFQYAAMAKGYKPGNPIWLV